MITIKTKEKINPEEYLNVKKTIKIISEVLSENYNIELSKAFEMVEQSFIPEFCDTHPEYISHYDAEYWAKELAELKRLKEKYE